MGSLSSVTDHFVCTESSLDDALSVVVLALESDEPLDRERLLARYPQWTTDLNQFIDNWLAMEQNTAHLAASRSGDTPIPAAELNGKIFGDYELLELISSGGMGVVYRAKQVSLGRIVALKMVLNAVRDKTRFRIEAEAAASLHHANIISIHEVGEFEGQPFISMQYVAGGNLHDHLKPGPMATRAAAGLVRTLAIAVHYAHQRGILHRDLKPANVLLDGERRPFVTDFGLAKQMGNSVELTRSGAIIGTPGYMAPEQAMGQVKSITVAADVYGLGAILYAALTGDAPFKSDSDLLTLRKVIEEPPTSPRVKRPELDRNLETICLKCLEKNPQSRYGSARQLAEDLTRYLRGEPVNARPVGFVERRLRWCARNPTLAMLSIVTSLMLLAVVLMSLSFGYREYVARLNDEYTRIREAAMTEAIDLAKVDAESKNHAAQQAIADLYTTNGLWAARSDLYGEALLWFARAAKQPGIDALQASESKVRCGSWMSQCPKPIAVLPLPTPLTADTFQRDWGSWQLSAARSAIIFKSGDDFGVWDFKTDEVWRPSAQDWKVQCASWSQDAKWLAIGYESGELRILHAATKEAKASVTLDEPISCVSFSEDNMKLAVGMKTKVLILANSSNLTIEHQWQTTAECRHVRFSADESRVLSVSSDGKASVHHLKPGEATLSLETSCFMPHSSTFAQDWMPDFSDDGTKLFVRSEARRVRIFDTISGNPLGKTIVTGTTESFAISPNQSHGATGGDSYARCLSFTWNDNVPSIVRHESRLAHNDAVTSVAFGGKKLIATAGRDQVVHLWNVGEPKSPGGLLNDRAVPLATMTHTDQLVGLLFPPGGRHLATVQRDGLIRVWQIPSFESPGYVVRNPRGGTTVKPLGLDRWLTAGSTHWGSNVVNASIRRLKDGMVVAETTLQGLQERGHLLDSAVNGDQSKLVSLHASPVRSGGTMVTRDESAGSIQVWELPEGRSYGPRIQLSVEPRAVAFHPSQSTAAVLLANKEIKLVDLAEPSILASILSPTNRHPLDRKTGLQPSNLFNGQLAFSPDGTTLFAWGVGKGFQAWDWASQKPRFSSDFAEAWSVEHLAIAPIGERIALAIEGSKQVYLLDSTNGQIVRKLDHMSIVQSVEFSPSGKELLTASEDGRARIINLDHVEDQGVDFVHEKSVLGACYSPDGSMIATLSSAMRVYVWRVRDRQWAFRPMTVPKATRGIVFSPCCRYLLTMGLGDENQVLDLNHFENDKEVDLEYVTNLGELVSAKTLGDSGIVNLTTAQWLERWNRFRSRVK